MTYNIKHIINWKFLQSIKTKMRKTKDPEYVEIETPVASTSAEAEQQEQPLYTITEDMLRRRLEQENKGRFLSQLCCAVAACLAALSFGTVLGWSSSASRHLTVITQKYNISEESYGWLASLTPLGCSLGIMPFSYGINTLGPKHTMILQTPFYILVILIMITLKTLDSFITGRFFSGFLSISYLMSGERLLVDSVHVGYLPIMTLGFRSSVLMGILVAYITGHYLSRFWLTIICGMIPFGNTAFLCILPESPVFLYNKSEKKAEKALQWYRGPTNIYMALQSIKKDSEMRKTGADSYRYMLYSKVVMKALLIVIGLNSFKVFSGYYVFVFYNLLLWQEFSTFDLKKDAVIFGCCLFISNLLGNLFRMQTDLGVRKPLLLSCSLIAVTLTALTIYTALYEHEVSSTLHSNWISVLIINMFVISFEIGLSTYPDVILYDYLPFQVHVKARTISQVIYWFEVFLLIKYYITIRNLTKNYVAFCILTIISYISIFYCYLCIIETKGKNLMQIQIEIGGNPIGNRGAYRHRREATYRQGICIN